MAKRILLSPSAYYPSLGGVEEICRNLAFNLKREGYEVAIATNRHPLTLPRQEHLLGVDVHRFDFYYPALKPGPLMRSWRSLVGLLDFCRFVRNWKPDVVHVICPSSNALYCWASQLQNRCKLLVTFQGELFMDQNRIYDRSKLFRFGLRLLLNVTDAVTACSHFVLDDAQKKYDIENIPCNVVFNGVDLEEGQSQAKARAYGRMFILGLGRLVANKGFDVLIKAFELISSSHPEVDLLIVGDGADREQLADLIERSEISERVFLVGRKERAEVATYFRDCLFFVLPSPVEPFGIVCLEAMRAGKAVIATNTGGPPEFIKQGVEGTLVPPSDVEALSQSIKHLLDDEQLRKSMGSAGFKTVRQFDWAKITRKYTDLYRQLV